MDAAEFVKRTDASARDRDAQIRQQLERILRSAGFQGANRRVRLLRYLVEQSLEEHVDALKESVIAVEVFDRAPDFNPQVDSSVRVEIGRLRSRLLEFYAENPDEPVRVEIPKGAYRPVFTLRNAPLTPSVSETQEQARSEVREPARSWKWAVILAAAAAVAVVTVWIWRARFASPSVPASIAVLPFLNLSGNTADDYLADGITDELTESVAEFADLRVVARTSAFQYKGKNADVREIGRNLGVGAVLEGSAARQSDGQLRVIAQLVRTSDGYHLWSHTYEATLGQLHEIEGGIAQAAREQLVPAPQGAPPREAGTRNPEAHDMYIRAVYDFNQRTVDSTRAAIDLAQQATQKDSSFAQPYVLMASAESQLNTLFAQAPDVAAKHEGEDVERALQLEPGNSAAHALKGMLAYTDEWNWPKAEREFELALGSGSHGAAESSYGWCLMTRGRFAESRKRLQHAAELDPLSLGPQLNQVEELIDERKEEEAKRIIDNLLQIAPNSPAALGEGLRVAFWRKDCGGASSLGQRLLALYPKSPNEPVIRAVAAAVCGREDEAAATLATMAKADPSHFLSAYQVAGAFSIGHDGDHALSYLQLAAERHEPALMSMGVDRVFEPLRHDSRFIALERKLGLHE